MELTLIITGGILLGCFLGISWFSGSDAPYVATKNERIKKTLKEAKLKKGEIFFELGSGDGRVVLEAARMGAKAYGIEQSWLRVLWSRYQSKKQNLPNAKFIHGNIFSSLRGATETKQSSKLNRLPRPSGARNDIVGANVVFIFLLPKGINKLEPILKRTLTKDARVITQTFHFKNWQPYKKLLVTDKNSPNTPLGKNVVEGDFWFYKV